MVAERQTQSLPKQEIVDISVNLLHQIFSDQAATRAKKTRETLISIGAMLVASLFVGGLAIEFLGEREHSASLATELDKEKSKLKQLGGVPVEEISEEVKRLPGQYKDHNSNLVLWMGSVLANVEGPMNLLNMKFSTSETGSLSLTGSAKTNDITAVRTMLDKVQGDVPTVLGMISGVTHDSTEQVGIVTVQFEIQQKPSELKAATPPSEDTNAKTTN
ncbi:MAG: hypothetical protein J0L72_05000 [Armatimonadetes bacterium]|nr:hypothetical protein [Armatimonadota bacterium]